MIRKEVFIGFVLGIISNTIGLLLCTYIVAIVKDLSFSYTLSLYYKSSNLWMLITLGALPNLAVFFGLLQINRDYRAKGVLLATFIAAISSYLIYFF